MLKWHKQHPKMNGLPGLSVLRRSSSDGKEAIVMLMG